MITETIITNVPTLPVTLARAKQHLNIEADFTGDDELIQGYLDAATEEAAAHCGRATLFQAVTWYLDNFDAVTCGSANANATVTTVEVLGDGGAYTELPDANYLFAKESNYAAGISFTGDDLPELPESDSAVKVSIEVACPKSVIAGILLRVGELYAYREDRGTGHASTKVLDLWRPYRKWN